MPWKSSSPLPRTTPPTKTQSVPYPPKGEPKIAPKAAPTSAPKPVAVPIKKAP